MVKKAKRWRFVVIDGVIGSGKGTQISLIKERLPEVVYTKDLEGPFSEQVRDLLMYTEEWNVEHRTPTSDLLMFWAAREVHVQNLIIPTLDRGKLLISEKFDSSTYAFQIFGEEHLDLLGLFLETRRKVLGKYKPDLYIILDLPPEVSLKRMEANLGKEKSRFDLKPIKYHRHVREGFRCFKEIGRCKFIDADREVDEVHKDILSVLSAMQF